MQYIIEHFSDYNPRRFGTPWAAPCLPDGRPNFKSNKVAHFTGGHGVGGDLFVLDPEPYSVYAYGQKDYRSTATRKGYAQFMNCNFWYVEPDELLTALKRWDTNRKLSLQEENQHGENPDRT